MANRWYESTYSSGLTGKKLKLHIYTIETNINENWTIERADLVMEVTNSGGGYFNNYGTEAFLGVNFHDTKQNVKWDARTTGIKNLITSWDTKVNHNDDGSKTLPFSAHHHSGTALGNANISGNFQCDTIPRASQPSIITYPNTTRDFNLGEKIYIHMNRKSDFVHTIKLTYGVIQNYTIATGVTNYFLWDTNTKYGNNTMFTATSTSNQKDGKIIVETYGENGKKLIGTKEVGFTAHVVNANPIFNNFTFADVNTNTVALTGNNQKVIKNYSTVQATISSSNKAIAQKGATMSKYKLQIGNKQVNKQYSTSEVSMQIANANNKIIRIYAIDSRGNATSKDLQPSEFIEYTPIKITEINAIRGNSGVSETVTLNFNGEYWNKSFGKVANTIVSVKYKYKYADYGNWVIGKTTITPTFNGNKFSFSGLIKGDLDSKGFTLDRAFDIQLEITDKLSTFTNSTLLGSGTPAIAMGRKGVSFGSPYNESNGGELQIKGENLLKKIYPVGSVYMSFNSTSPSSLFGGTWEQIQGRFLLGVGTAGANSSNFYGDLNKTNNDYWTDSGSKAGQFYHTLTESEMPSHKHTIYANYTGSTSHAHFGADSNVATGIKGGGAAGTPNMAKAGGGQKHNNMPPFITVYMWKRTA